MSEAYFWCLLWVGCFSKEICGEGLIIKVNGNHGEVQEEPKCWSLFATSQLKVKPKAIVLRTW